MRKLLAILSFIIFSTQTWAYTPELIPICSIFNIKKVKTLVIPHPSDKFVHCSVSCMLARRCGADDAFEAGVYKEIWDLFGPGNAEWEDIEADAFGVNIFLDNPRLTDKDCNSNCLKIYPKN